MMLYHKETADNIFCQWHHLKVVVCITTKHLSISEFDLVDSSKEGDCDMCIVILSVVMSTLENNG